MVARAAPTFCSVTGASRKHTTRRGVLPARALPGCWHLPAHRREGWAPLLPGSLGLSPSSRVITEDHVPRRPWCLPQGTALGLQAQDLAHSRRLGRGGHFCCPLPRWGEPVLLLPAPVGFPFATLAQDPHSYPSENILEKAIRPLIPATSFGKGNPSRPQ